MAEIWASNCNMRMQIQRSQYENIDLNPVSFSIWWNSYEEIFNGRQLLYSKMALSALGHLKIDLIIPKKLDNGLVTVYFNQTVDCKGRQVVKMYSNVYNRIHLDNARSFCSQLGGGCFVSLLFLLFLLQLCQRFLLLWLCINVLRLLGNVVRVP